MVVSKRFGNIEKGKSEKRMDESETPLEEKRFMKKIVRKPRRGDMLG